MQVTLIMMILWKAYALPVANHSATNEAGFKSRSLKQVDSEIIWHFELKSVCLGMYKTDGKDRETIGKADDDHQCTEDADPAEDTGIYANKECYRGTCEEGLCTCCHPLTESLAETKDLKKPYGVWHGANCGQFTEIKKLKGELEDEYEKWQKEKRLQQLEKQDKRKEELMAEDAELGEDYRPESPRKPKSSDPCVMGDTCFRGFCREDGKDLVCKDCFTYDDPLPGKYQGEFCTVFIPDYSFGERAKTPACVTHTDCTNHGFCNDVVQPSLCICDPGWSGYHCEKKPLTKKCYSTDKGTCNKKGKCKKKTDPEFGKYRYCQCKKGYGGLACEKPFQCLKDGLNMCYLYHGKCKGSSKKECECTLDSSKYIGKYCRPKKLQSGGAEAVQTGEKSGEQGDAGAEHPKSILKVPVEFRHRGNGRQFSKQLGDKLESGQLSPLRAHLQELFPNAEIKNVRFNLEPTIIEIKKRRAKRLGQEEMENYVGSPNHDEKLVNGKSKSLKRSKSKSLKRSKGKSLKRRKSKSLKRSKSLVKRQDDAQQDIVTLFDVTFGADEGEDVGLENIQELVTENLSEQTEILSELYGSEFSYVEGSVKTGKVELLSAGDDGSSNKTAFFAVIGAGGLFVIGGVCAVIKTRQSQASVGKKDKNKKKQPSKKSGKSKSALDVGSYTDGTEERRKKSKSLASGKKSKSRATSKAAVSAKSSNRSTAA